MKKRLNVWNIIAFLTAPLNFADHRTQAGGGRTSTVTGAYTGGEVARVQSVFDSIPEWTPGQFRNALQPEEVLKFRDPSGNTLLHKALEADNIGVASIIVKEYNIESPGDLVNASGMTCRELAAKKGGEFAGIFADMAG